MFSTGISTSQLREGTKERINELKDSLEQRFTHEMSLNLIFYCFGVLNSYFNCEKGNSSKSLIEDFQSQWKSGVRGRVNNELKTINSSISNDFHSRILQSITNYSLPSTEDTQLIYNKAIDSTIYKLQDVMGELNDSKIDSDTDQDDEPDDEGGNSDED